MNDKPLHPKSKKTVAPWQTQLGAFFKYPARSAILPAVLVLVVCTVFASYLSIVGLIIAAIITLFAYTFSFEILQHHANGWEEPPESVVTASSSLVFYYLVALFIGAILIGVTHKLLGLIPGLALLAAFCLIQPAFTMISVIEGNVFSALNPSKWLRLMSTFGNGYFLLAGVLFFGQLLEGWASAAAFSFMPSFLATAIVKTIGLWLLFSSAYWMGYLIYQHHLTLGFEPNAYEHEAIRGSDKDLLLIEEIETAIQEKYYADAIRHFTEKQRERVIGIAAHQKYRELLLKKGDASEIRSHAKTFLHQLLTEKNYPRATSLSIQQFHIDEDFSPLDADACNSFLHELQRQGQVNLEKKLLRSLIKHFYDENALDIWANRYHDILKHNNEPLEPLIKILDSALAATSRSTQRERIITARKAITKA